MPFHLIPVIDGKVNHHYAVTYPSYSSIEQVRDHTRKMVEQYSSEIHIFKNGELIEIFDLEVV